MAAGARRYSDRPVYGSRGDERGRLPCWRDVVTLRERPGPIGYDPDRLRGLEKAGLTEAAEMLREEIAVWRA